LQSDAELGTLLIDSMAGPRTYLRPQDILIALKVKALEGDSSWTQARIAFEIGVSPTEVAFALQRLKTHGFMNEDKRTLKPAALFEFLVHGLKYVFPAELGAPARGVPTGTSIPPLKALFRAVPDQTYVWPDPDGSVRGITLAPLYESAPQAAMKDLKLYTLLGLVDTVRLGGAREVAAATQALQKHLLGKKRA
jgi:hypothetical protein